MKRIIRSNAVKTSNELTSFVPTKEGSTSVMEDRVNSVSLQTILNRQPLVVPYLVVLSGIAFLASSSIWAMNTRVEEASLHFELAPSIGTPKALKTANSVNYHTGIKIIPKQFKTTGAHIKYQAEQPTQVRFVHTYRVVDMFFEE
jgi:hypothetical protein